MSTREILGKPSGEVSIERFESGKPHQGKVLAAVQAHADDIPLFCAGAIAKLIDEGYTGYLIQTTNDEKCGPPPSIGATVDVNEREIDDLAQTLGLKEVFHLSYRTRRLELLQAYVSDHGALPAGNTDIDADSLGRIRPG